MSNPNQKVYTLALGKCTGEFTIAYDFSESLRTGGSITISEYSQFGVVNNTFYENSGSRSALIDGSSNTSVAITNHFSYPIVISINLCSFSKQTETIQPYETRTFTKDFGGCNYNVSWQPQFQQKLSSQSTTPGSIAVTWADVSLNSGDTTGAGSLSLVKDQATPTTGKLIITAPPGANWSVYLDCPFCEPIPEDSGSGSESYESESYDSESELVESGSESESESGSESDCCKVKAPADAGVVLNPYEYMVYWDTCYGGYLDIEMTPKCPTSSQRKGSVKTAQTDSINAAQTGSCCGSAIEGGWVCLGSQAPTEEACNSMSWEGGQTQWVSGGCDACDSLNNSGGASKCTGGDPMGSRVHMVDVTPEMVEQFWQDLLDSCQGTAYGPFPIMINPSCATTTIGQEPTGLDAGGNDMQNYIDRNRKNYCHVDQEIKPGPLYMIGSDGRGGCVPIPMKYVICNGCYVGFGFDSCGGDGPPGPDSECPSDESGESDSGSEWQSPPLPPPALPPEQPVDGLGGQAFRFFPFNPPVPPVGGQAGGQPGQPRAVRGRVGRNGNGNRIVAQQGDDCTKDKILLTFTGTFSDAHCPINKITVKCFLNGVQSTADGTPLPDYEINNPDPGMVLDHTWEVMLGVQDNGQYWFEVLWEGDPGSCVHSDSLQTAAAPVEIIEQRMFTEYKTCATGVVQKEVYCDGTIEGGQIPDTIEGEDVCYKCLAFVEIPGSDSEDPLYGNALTNSCGDTVTATLFKKEHQHVGSSGPTGCANYKLTYQLISDEFRKSDASLVLTLPVRGQIHAFTGSGSQSVNMSKEPTQYDTGSISSLEYCTEYTSPTTTPPPTNPEEASIIQRMYLDRSGQLINTTVVGTSYANLLFQAGTKFFFDNGTQVMCDFNMGFQPVGGINNLDGPGNQWGLAGMGGWFFRTLAGDPGLGAIYQIFTWDQGGMGEGPPQNARDSLSVSNHCQPMEVNAWDQPANFVCNGPPDITPQKAQEMAQAVANGDVAWFKLDREDVVYDMQGVWREMAGLGYDPNTNRFTGQMSNASTWNIDTKTKNVCGTFLVYPPSELLKSRKIVAQIPFIQSGLGGQTKEVMDYFNKNKGFRVSPGIGIRFKALNSDVFNGQVVDTILGSWPQIFLNWPKDDPKTGQTIKYTFEFYDTKKEGPYNVRGAQDLQDIQNQQFTIQSGIPAPPGDPNAPALCKMTYENGSPGITPLCILTGCGDTTGSCGSISKTHKKYKNANGEPGDGVGGQGAAP